MTAPRDTRPDISRPRAFWRDRDRENRRTTFKRPTHHFLSDDMWALADNPDFEWFCLRAHLVDDFQPLPEGALALAVHDADGHDAATNDDFDTVDEVSVKFQTHEVGDPPLWRCDWQRNLRDPFSMGLAGAYNRELLAEFQRADILLLVTVQWFEIWQMDHVFAVIPNDRDFWLEREPPEHDHPIP